MNILNPKKEVTLMLVSTKGRYALRTMVDLALHADGDPVKIKDIAKRQEISGKYLEQIISILSRAGYVRSIRGNQGGYYLSRPASEYTVGMILRVTEGSLAPVDCLTGEENPCSRQQACVTLRLWKELDESIRHVVDHYTLEDLVRWQEAQQDNYII